MQSSQFNAQQLLGILRRRRRLLVGPALLVAVLSAIGAFILPRKYESSATILVQRDEILNPLVSFTMAVTIASEDRMKSLNEILYSQSTIQVLIDSLKLGGLEPIRTEAARQELMKEVRKNITTDRPSPTSIKIAFMDTDPQRAQRGVAMLCDMVITTTLQVENQRNELAVQFYETKLIELRSKFEDTQREMVSLVRRRIDDLPTEDRMIPGKIEDTDTELQTIDERIKTYQQGLTILSKFPEAFRTDQGKQALYDILRLPLPYAADLRPLVTRYDDLSQRYTSRYPEVQKLEFQVRDLLQVMRSAVESELFKTRNERNESERKRNRLVDNLKHASVSARLDQDKESSYDIYRKLYDDMKVKLEQARTNRDLGRKAKDSFNIIDPPLAPMEPSKPNRLLIILGGIGLGCFIGLITAGTAELLDTTVRTRTDVSVYQKPIVAFIPNGKLMHRA